MAEDKKTQMGTGTMNAVTPPRTGPPNTSPPPVGSYASPGGTPVPMSHQDSGAATMAAIPGPATPPGAPAATAYIQGPPPVDPLIGQTLADRYYVQKKLGEGGMGAVYLATHRVLEKQVALKVLHGEFARKPDLVTRFMQEAKAASRIRHENVIDVSDFGSTPDGLVFFAMELLKGHDLHEEVARARIAGELLPWARTKRIFLQICSALSAAHALGIVHRDLKPENIYLVEFLDDNDFVKLLDFGIAKLTEVSEDGRKLTRTGMLFGTPEYMSPEQARGDVADHRVDIYAMGCILFQLITTKVPFEAENFMGVLSQHLTEPPPAIPPDVFDRVGAPRALAQVIDKALEKEKTARYQSIDEFAAAVRQVSGDPPATGRGTGVQPAIRATAAIQAPAETTTPRPRTQWTGTVKVPEEGERISSPPEKKSSKLPFIVGGVVIAVGAAVATVVVLGHDGGGNGPVAVGSGSTGSGSAGSRAGSAGSAGSGSAAIAMPPPTPIDAGVLGPPLPGAVIVTIESTPPGAAVLDVNNAKLGITPWKHTYNGDRNGVQFVIHMSGFNDEVVNVDLDKDKFDQNVKLTRGHQIAKIQPLPPKVPTTPNTGSAGSANQGAVTQPTPTPVDAGAAVIAPPQTPIDAAPVAPPPVPIDAPCIPDPAGGCLKPFGAQGAVAPNAGSGGAQ